MIFKFWSGDNKVELPKTSVLCDFYYFECGPGQSEDVIVHDVSVRDFRNMLLASLTEGKHVVGIYRSSALPELPLKKHYYEDVVGHLFVLGPSAKGLFHKDERDDLLKNFEGIISYLKSQKFKA